MDKKPTKEDYVNSEKAFFESVLNLLGDDLLMYCVTGSLVRDEIIPGWSDIDILMVTNKCDDEVFEKINKSLLNAKKDGVKIGVTFYSLDEFNNELFKDSKTHLSTSLIKEGFYEPRIISERVKLNILPEEVKKINDLFELSRFIHDVKRELLLLDNYNEQKVYKLSMTLLKILLRRRGIVALNYKDAIKKSKETIKDFPDVNILTPKEIISNPGEKTLRYNDYSKLINWITSNSNDAIR